MIVKMVNKRIQKLTKKSRFYYPGYVLNQDKTKKHPDRIPVFRKDLLKSHN